MDRRALLRVLAGSTLAAACGPARPRTVATPTSGSGTERPVVPVTPRSPSSTPAGEPTSEAEPATPDPTVEPETDPTVVEPTPEPTSAPPPAALTVAVLCRDAWGARPATGAYEPHTVRQLTIHHSATVLGDNAKAPGRFRQHQRFHQDNGWPDIAYHHGVDRRGNVYELRPTDAAGDTFTEYDPAGHYLLLAEGNFDQESPTDAQLEAIAQMLAWAARAFAVDLSTLSGHRDHAATSCPGDNLYPRLGELRQRAGQLGMVEVTSECGDAGRDRVAAIERGA